VQTQHTSHLSPDAHSFLPLPFATSVIMRWISLLLPLALPFGTLAAKKSASDSLYDQFHAQALSSTPIQLNDASYTKLTAASRDFTSAILLTAMSSRFGCEMCRDFQPEWELLAKSWTKGDKRDESRLIFGTLDFTDGRDTFISV
jgi:oligosaccharyltransferase complex subunit gamma